MTYIFPSRFRFRLCAYNPGQQQRNCCPPHTLTYGAGVLILQNPADGQRLVL